MKPIHYLRSLQSQRQFQLLGLAVLALFCMLSIPRAAAQQQAVLLQNARIIVGDGSVLEAASLLMQGGRIEDVGDPADMNLPRQLTVVDLSGKTVMPTMIDAHAHLGYEGHSSWGAENYNRENLIDHLQRYTYYGFSAVFSAGSDPDELAYSVQQEIDSQQVQAARFLFAAGMGPPGQGPNDQFLAHALAVAEQTGMNILYGIGSERDAELAVREVAERGLKFIKIWVDDRGGSQEKLTPELYRKVIQQADQFAIPVFVHQQAAEDMSALLDAGADGFLHGRLGRGLDSSLAAKISQAGAFVVPNLGLGELRRQTIGDDQFLRESLPPSVANRLTSNGGVRQQSVQLDAQRELEMSESFRALLDADVDIVLGTDSGAVPDHFFGYTGHRELEIFVRLGMDTMQALISATSLPAKSLGLVDAGLIASGYRADLLVLDENPVIDIRNTRSISRVILAGVEVDRSALAEKFIRE